MTGLPSGFFAPGTCPRGFRFFSGMKASSSMKASASVRMMPSTRGLNQLADTPATDSRRRSRMVTSASAFEQGRPDGVNPALLHTGTRKPRSSIWIGTWPLGLLGLLWLLRPPGVESSGTGAWLNVR